MTGGNTTVSVGVSSEVSSNAAAVTASVPLLEGNASTTYALEAVSLSSETGGETSSFWEILISLLTNIF